MIASNLKAVKRQIPEHVTLVAVSKTKPVSDLLEAYAAGQRDFGENKAQEVLDKFEYLPEDVRWHFIGHLQTNKVKQIVDKVYLVHSMDRESLFVELEKQASKINKTVHVLLQFNIAQEETKYGFSWDMVKIFLNSDIYKDSKFVRVVGVMGMASFTENKEQIKQEFDILFSYFEQLKSGEFLGQSNFHIVSMGMSGDFELAIASGSTMVRVGSAIFGGR